MKLKSLEQSHGPVVAEIRDRVQLRDPPAASGGSDHAASRLGGVTLTDVLGQQRKAKIGVSQEIALDALKTLVEIAQPSSRRPGH